MSSATVDSSQSAPSAPSAAPASGASSASRGSTKGSSAPSQGASKPPAPSQPAPVANQFPKSRIKRDHDPLKAAHDRATAAATQKTPEGSEAPINAPATAPAPQDAAKATLATGRAAPQAPAAPAAPVGQHGGAPTPQQTPNELEALRRSNSQFGREMAEMKRQLAAYQQSQAAAKAAAEQAKVKPYMASHPENAATMQRIAKADAFDAALSAIPKESQTPDLVRSLAQKMGVGQEDLNLRNDWKAHREQVQAQMAADPDAFIAQRAEQIATQKFEQLFQSKLRETKIHNEVATAIQEPDVKQFLATPENVPIFRKAVEDMGGNVTYAAHMAKMSMAGQRLMQENAELKARLAAAQGTSGHAEEQQRLLKARASHTREVASQTQSIKDPLKVARAWAAKNDEHASMSNPRFVAELNRIMLAARNQGA